MDSIKILLFVGFICASFSVSASADDEYNPFMEMSRFIKGVYEPGGVAVNNRHDKADHKAVCKACSFVVNTITDFYDSGASGPEIIANLTKYCLAFDFTQEECDNMFNMYLPEVWYMLEHGEINNDTWCALLLGEGCGAWNEINSWRINTHLLQGPPPLTPEMPLPGFKTSKILHMSDFHLDLTYKPGSTGEGCGSFMCCTERSEFPANASNQEAGYWGT